MVNDDQWHRIVGTMEASPTTATRYYIDRRLYLDGAEVASDLGLAYGGPIQRRSRFSAIFFGDSQPGDPNATKQNYEGDDLRTSGL